MKQQRKKVLFLYFELAGYFLACVKRLTELYAVDVHIVRYPVNTVAPFNFKDDLGITFYEYCELNRTSLIELTKNIDPDIIYICGWSNKDYVAVGKLFRNKIPVLLTFDNPWLGTFKQQLAALVGPLYLHSIFSHCWVPGEPNAVYARKLGFKGNKLLQGMYAADYDLFHSYYNEFKLEKEKHFPKRFIFVGRYVALKGVREIWEAFIRLQEEQPNEWELWCLGKGDLDNEFPVHEKIKNFGFIQPDELKTFIQQTGVFLLPAYYEHWGVVVHEFAAAGFPLLCTATTSAATTFLKDGYNGYFLEPKSVDSMKEAYQKIIALSDQQLNEMSKHSAEMAKQITPTTWAKTLMSTL